MMTAPLIASHPAPDDRSTNPFRTTITSHPTFDDRSTDHEPSSAQPTLDDCSTYRPMDTITAPLPLITCTYKNTFIIINNNKTYLIIQTKTRPHKLLTAGAPSFFTAGALSFLTGGAPAKPSHSRSTQLSHSTSTKPSHSRSTIQAFSQQEYSAFSQHEHQASLQ